MIERNDTCRQTDPRTFHHLEHVHLLVHIVSSPPLPARYKFGVSRVYARPRPLSPAGGNTLDDITTALTHWPWDVPHLPNRLPVKWRQLSQSRSLSVEWVGQRDGRRQSQRDAARWLAHSGESERLLLREKREGEQFARGTDEPAAPNNSCRAPKQSFVTYTYAQIWPLSMLLFFYPVGNL